MNPITKEFLEARDEVTELQSYQSSTKQKHRRLKNWVETNGIFLNPTLYEHNALKLCKELDYHISVKQLMKLQYNVRQRKRAKGKSKKKNEEMLTRQEALDFYFKEKLKDVETWNVAKFKLEGKFGDAVSPYLPYLYKVYSKRQRPEIQELYEEARIKDESMEARSKSVQTSVDSAEVGIQTVKFHTDFLEGMPFTVDQLQVFIEQLTKQPRFPCKFERKDLRIQTFQWHQKHLDDSLPSAKAFDVMTDVFIGMAPKNFWFEWATYNFVFDNKGFDLDRMLDKVGNLTTAEACKYLAMAHLHTKSWLRKLSRNLLAEADEHYSKKHCRITELTGNCQYCAEEIKDPIDSKAYVVMKLGEIVRICESCAFTKVSQGSILGTTKLTLRELAKQGPESHDTVFFRISSIPDHEHTIRVPLLELPFAKLPIEKLAKTQNGRLLGQILFNE